MCKIMNCMQGCKLAFEYGNDFMWSFTLMLYNTVQFHILSQEGQQLNTVNKIGFLTVLMLFHEQTSSALVLFLQSGPYSELTVQPCNKQHETWVIAHFGSHGAPSILANEFSTEIYSCFFTYGLKYTPIHPTQSLSFSLSLSSVPIMCYEDQ